MTLNEDKQAEAQRIAQRDGITEGLVCVLRCVEGCKSFAIRRDGKGGFGFRQEDRRCLYLYYYYLDREFGLMHVRVATWLPFGIQVCLNGREYLARRMCKAGIGFQQRDNCFVWIEDLPRAQQMLADLEARKWERWLTLLAKRVNPLLGQDSGLDLHPYYWSICESEYATDVMFRDAPALAKVYPALLHHAIQRFASADVLRFLGRRTSSRFNGEVTTSYQVRPEGARVKHRIEENSLKMYDKQGSVLRIETTINNARRFRVRRMKVRQGIRRMRWIPMRQGVVDLERRVEISRAANGAIWSAGGRGDTLARPCLVGWGEPARDERPAAVPGVASGESGGGLPYDLIQQLNAQDYLVPTEAELEDRFTQPTRSERSDDNICVKNNLHEIALKTSSSVRYPWASANGSTFFRKGTEFSTAT